MQVSEEAYNLLKFHGSYEQFDRDTRRAQAARAWKKNTVHGPRAHARRAC